MNEKLLIKMKSVYIRKFVRIASALLLFLLFSVSMHAQITVDANDQTIKQVLKMIEKKSEFQFFYNAKFADLDKKVTISVVNQPVEAVMDVLLSGTQLMYEKKEKNQIVLFPKSQVNNAAQDKTPKLVSGIVSDEQGSPIIGASIVEKGTKNGVVTDLGGKFSITTNSDAILEIFYLGYATQEISVKDKTVADIRLAEDTKRLDEVVVVGYGTQTHREVTGSVAQITPKDFNKGFSSNAADLLKGKVAGLVINNGTGDVTSGSSIRLRGVSTLQNDAGPFVVIDGIPGADMATISSQDIESISILKDASSAAIYGSRSAGGVILITTKRGTVSKPTLNYTGAVGFATLANKPDLLNADEWRAVNTELDQSKKPEDRNQWQQFDLGANTDWFDEITRTAFQQDHSISLSGGGTNNTYRGSVSYLEREGVARDNSLERYNMRLQFSQYALNNKLKIDMTGVMTLSNNSPAYARNFLLAYNMLPVSPVKNPDGTWFDSQEYDQGNPVRNQTENSQEYQTNNSYGTISARLDIIEGLNTKLMVAKSRISDDYSRYNSKKSEAGLGDNGFAQRSGTINNMDLLEWTSNYNKKFNEHKIDAMVGYSWQQDDISRHNAQNRNFVSDMLQSNDLESGMGLRVGDVSSSMEESCLISFFARASYNYKEKYVLTASYRRDGSSKFGSDNKWGNFPAISGAWNIHEENFMEDVSWISSLKFRAGYGSMGNQSGLQPYKTLSLYGEDGRYYDNGSWKRGYGYSQNRNSGLKWETTSMFNVGVDFDLFKGRLSGAVEWYDKETSDMLYNYPVPVPPNQYGYKMMNIGAMRNRGVELSLNALAISTHDFSWNIALELSHNKNVVTKLESESEGITMERQLLTSVFWRGGGGSTHILEVGRPVGQFYGLQCTGLDDKGRYIFVDQTGEGDITEPGDYTYIGDANPKLDYGLTNTFRYKNWDFSFFLRGSLGNDLLNVPRIQFAQSGFLPGANALDDPLTTELKDTPTFSSFYLENGSYLRLDNVSLGYNFKWLNGVRVYGTVQNLFVITNYKGVDPELPISLNQSSSFDNPSAGLSPGVESREFYPKARTFSIGLSMNF